MQFFNMRQFLPAWATPSRPEIDEDRLPLQVRKLPLLPLQIRQRKIRQWFVRRIPGFFGRLSCLLNIVATQ